MLVIVHKLSTLRVVIMSRTLKKHFPAIKLCAEEKQLNKRKKMIDVTLILLKP